METRLTETARLEAFSDGVFAIAITLLVLELIQSFHRLEAESLLQAILNHWQPFGAFVIGFITILICWINHHHVLTYIKKIDSTFLWVNGFLLFMVTLTPFPTAILAGFLKTESTIALALFGFNYFMIAMAAYAICSYAYNNRFIEEESRTYFRCVKISYGYSILYTLVAFMMCFISRPVAIVLYILLFAVFAFPDKLAMRLLKKVEQSQYRKSIKKPALQKKVH